MCGDMHILMQSYFCPFTRKRVNGRLWWLPSWRERNLLNSNCIIWLRKIGRIFLLQCLCNRETFYTWVIRSGTAGTIPSLSSMMEICCLGMGHCLSFSAVFFFAALLPFCSAQLHLSTATSFMYLLKGRFLSWQGGVRRLLIFFWFFKKNALIEHRCCTSTQVRCLKKIFLYYQQAQPSFLVSPEGN